MNLYPIKRKAGASYEETGSAVIAAENVPRVRVMARELPGEQDADEWTAENATVTLLGTSRAKTAKIVHVAYLNG